MGVFSVLLTLHTLSAHGAKQYFSQRLCFAADAQSVLQYHGIVVPGIMEDFGQIHLSGFGYFCNILGATLGVNIPRRRDGRGASLLHLADHRRNGGCNGIRWPDGEAGRGEGDGSGVSPFVLTEFKRKDLPVI